jgi:RNA polymerase sigma-70 factor (ECF subfamily)
MTEPPAPPAFSGLSPDERRLVEALRARDEAAFMELIDRYQVSLVRVAMMYVGSRAVAEDVVGETWLGVLRWIYRILTNTAKTRAQRERRSIPFASLGDGDDGPAVNPDRFLPPGDPAAGAWASPPRGWDALPEATLLSAETRSVIDAAIDQLPPTQREVIRLRDVEGFSSGEVRALLELSETNQRVLLHRARSKVRAALERYLAEDTA